MFQLCIQIQIDVICCVGAGYLVSSIMCNVGRDFGLLCHALMSLISISYADLGLKNILIWQ